MSCKFAVLWVVKILAAHRESVCVCEYVCVWIIIRVIKIFSVSSSFSLPSSFSLFKEMTKKCLLLFLLALLCCAVLCVILLLFCGQVFCVLCFVCGLQSAVCSLVNTTLVSCCCSPLFFSLNLIFVVKNFLPTHTHIANKIIN